MAREPIVDDAALLAALLSGDESAFASLVMGWSPWMMRVAMAYVPTREVAEDVVQEAWLEVLAGLSGFEGRSTLRTWVFRIVARRAMRTGPRERRALPLSSRWREERAPAVDPDRFDADGGWVVPPQHWELDPDLGVRGAGLREALEEAIAGLPTRQRQVLVARDVWGLGVAEVSTLLGVSANHQGVLLHRARSRLRNHLESRLWKGES